MTTILIGLAVMLVGGYFIARHRRPPSGSAPRSTTSGLDEAPQGHQPGVKKGAIHDGTTGGIENDSLGG